MKNKEIQAKIAKKIRQIEELEEQLKEHKFKVGDFITSTGAPKHFGIITKLEFIDDESLKYYYDGFDGHSKYTENNYYFTENDDYHPNDKQILEHLTKVAELKGLVNGVEVASAYSGRVFTIDNNTLNYNENGLLCGGLYLWDRPTNTWAKKVEVDFSILNDVEVFYVETKCGNNWLAKGNIISFDESVKTYHYLLDSSDTYDSGQLTIKGNIKSIRKVTQEEEEEFNSKFPKYEVYFIVEGIYRIKLNNEPVIMDIQNKQLAKDICEFLNKRK